MFVRRLSDCEEIVAADASRLRELLHPDRSGPALGYSLALARVEPGGATVPHRLTHETEVYYLVSGAGRMHVDSESADVGPGDVVSIPAGARQWIECSGEEPLLFLCIVSPPWQPDHDVRDEHEVGE